MTKTRNSKGESQDFISMRVKWLGLSGMVQYGCAYKTMKLNIKCNSPKISLSDENIIKQINICPDQIQTESFCNHSMYLFEDCNLKYFFRPT